MKAAANSSAAVRKSAETRVSPDSLVSDLVWDFRRVWLDRSVPMGQKLLKWDFEVGKGERFTEPRFEALRRSAQRALHQMQKNNGVPQRPSTVVRNFSNLKALIRFMVDRNLSAFRSITPAHATSYKASVLGSGLSPQRRFGRLRVLQYLHDLKAQLDDHLGFNPFREKTPFETVGTMREEQRDRKTPAIPDLVAQALVRHATELVLTSSGLIHANAAREDAAGHGASRASNSRARSAAAASAGFPDGLHLTRSLTLLRTACLILLLFFTGVRKGESASFMDTSLSRDEEGYIWLHGRTTKLQRKKAKWMVPPIVEKAVAVATELKKPLVDKLKAEERWIRANLKECRSLSRISALRSRLQEISELKGHLFICEGSGTEASEFGNRIGVLTNTWDCLRSFAKAFDLKHEGSVWPLACHQFRRTFAKFMAANLLNLRFLQEHFKHLRLDMTAWYDTDDVEMSGLILEYYEEFKTRTLSGIMDRGLVGGKAGAGLREERESRYMGIADTRGKAEFVSSLSSAINFKSTGISYCMGFRDRGLCTGVVGCMLDPRNIRKCENAFVPEEFLPAWKAMESRCISAIASSDIGPVEKEIQVQLLEETIVPIILELGGKREAA